MDNIEFIERDRTFIDDIVRLAEAARGQPPEIVASIAQAMNMLCNPIAIYKGDTE